jgi:hypothetical protein
MEDKRDVEWKMQRDLRKILGKSREDPKDIHGDLGDIQRDLEEV